MIEDLALAHLVFISERLHCHLSTNNVGLLLQILSKTLLWLTSVWEFTCRLPLTFAVDIFLNEATALVIGRSTLLCEVALPETLARIEGVISCCPIALCVLKSQGGCLWLLILLLIIIIVRIASVLKFPSSFNVWSVILSRLRRYLRE